MVMRARTFQLVLTISVLLAVPAASFSEEAPSAGKASEEIGSTLDLEKCLEMTLRRQPGIRAARGQAAASASRVGQAKGGYYPVVDLNAGYDWNGSSSSGSDRSGDGFTSSVNLFQNIFDFGRRPSQVRIQELGADAFRFELRSAVSDATFNTKQAYYGLLQAKRNAELAREIIRQFERQLDQAKGFFEVGLRPRFDVTRAEVDLSNARVSLIRAENAIRLSMARLKGAIGVPEAPDFEVIDDLELKRVDIKKDEAAARALEARGELLAASERRKAGEEAVELARSGYYPFVTGSADYTWDDGSNGGDGWSAALNLTLPVFNGFLTKHRVGESRANLAVFSADEDAVRQNVIFEVEEAWSNLREADERIPAAELALRQAEENLEIANGRYASGVGSPIEVTDAAVLFVNAKTAYIQALTDYKTAAASLERAMGDTGDDY